MNHAEILDGLRKLKYSVLDLASLGDGCPDAAIGWAAEGVYPAGCALLEIKKPGPPSARKLTPAEQRVRNGWEAPYILAQSLEEAAAELLILKRGWK